MSFCADVSSNTVPITVLSDCPMRAGCPGSLYQTLVKMAACCYYRGSLGFGEDSIQSLPGRVGTNDVTDCIAALDASIEQGKNLCFGFS